METKITLTNIIKHLKLITTHKWIVFKLCCKAGKPWRGLLHDMSKYSPTEFIESIRYYTGTHSPITEAKREKGYSDAWLHHKGRNRHHSEYWIDEAAPNKTPMMPYPYAVEMICDKLAAGIVYEGKKWTKEYELSYWNNEKDKICINPKTKEFVTEVMEQVAKNDIKKTLTKKNIKQIYQKHCNIINAEDKIL